MVRPLVAPTKTNLLRTKRDLHFAEEGHELLGQKREILVAELMAISDKAKKAQKGVEEKLQKAFNALEYSIRSIGKDSVLQAAYAVNIKTNMSVSTRSVMGVEVPIIETNIKKHPPYFSLFGSGLCLDETIKAFLEVLQLVGKYAEAKITLQRLAKEVKKTIRRVNALEKISLPDYKQTLKYIQDMIEEQDRQTFYTVKMVKSRLKKKKQSKNN